MRTSFLRLSFAAVILAPALLLVWTPGQARLEAQRLTVGNALRQYVSVDAPVVAITHVRIIDGTGAPARADQTIVLRDGAIAAMGPSASVAAPAGATVIDGTGKSVIPGLVMLHEHTYYPTGPGVYGQLGSSFTRLYLAGGVTTMRTAGNTNGIMDIILKQRIDRGESAGPAMDATAPVPRGPEHPAADARARRTRPTRGDRSTTGPTWARRRSRPT